MSYAIEHGSTRTGRWFRQQRLKITLGLVKAVAIAVVAILAVVALVILFTERR